MEGCVPSDFPHKDRVRMRYTDGDTKAKVNKFVSSNYYREARNATGGKWCGLKVRKTVKQTKWKVTKLLVWCGWSHQ